MGAGDNTIPLGNGDTFNAAAGSNVTGNDNVAIGTNAGIGVTANATTSIGYNASATAANAIAMGANAQASGANSISIGTGNVVSGANSGAFGDPSTITGAGSYSLGNNNTINANNAFVVGGGVTIPTGLDGAVVLGNASTVSAAVPTPNAVIGGTTYTFAGGAPTAGDVVSVGSATAPRQIQNVAAGQLSATSTDAVNGSQLFATNTALEDIAGDITAINNGGGIKYFHANSTEPDSQAIGTDSVAIGPNAVANNTGDVALGAGSTTATAVGTASTTIAGTTYNFAGINPLSTVSVGAPGAERTITNVAAGQLSATSTDAVNGSQLFATNTAVEDIAGDITAINNGGGIKYFHANSTEPDSQAIGTDSVAIGPNAVSNIDGSIALGAGSIADRALAPTNGMITAGTGIVPYNTADMTLLGTLSVGSAGAYRQVTNVADATQDQDAVTLRQLRGAITSVTSTGTRYFHANSTDPDSLAVGDQAIAVGPNTVVNGDNGIGMGNGARVMQAAPGGIAIGQNSTVNFADGLALGNGATSSGIQSISVGTGASTTGAGAVALGAGANGQGANSMALGTNAQAANAGDVALGSGSQTSAVTPTASATFNSFTISGFAGANPTSAVSIGSAGNERQLQNVAAGQITATSTDAINGSQLYAFATVLDNSVLGGGGIKYFHSNSSAADSVASGVESVAVGPQAVSSGASAIAMGNGAAASASDSVAIGAGAKATQANSLALGANSTTTANLSDAAYTPVVGASTAGVPTGEVSVGSAGAERRVTNVAAGAAPTDAVNVSQLQSLSNLSLKYDVDNTGNVTNQVTLRGGDPNAPVTISNVAPGVNGTDAVNVNQLNSAFGMLNGSIYQAKKEAWRGAAIGIAAASLRYDERPGKLSVAAGGGVWHGQGALSMGLGYTSEDGLKRLNASATTSGGHWGLGAGLSITLN
ncbi:YadA-like family protein [Chelatococcus sp. GCM10030263]|uniref:YadA-like family protein n=1 Tax=Chelatococcus sp. GCM10030263 TaxID=3273387 RepID=UPI0036086E79